MTLPPLLTPGSADELAAELARAAKGKRVVVPLGLGTRGPLGARGTPAGLRLSTAGLARIVAHDAADYTLTAEAGLPLDRLDDLLAPHGQWLPHQPYRRRGTLGGLLASGADSALALRHGRVRDDVLGARVALADGSLARGRGRVVKNVAGYDVPRLLCGSLGTLGIIVEASLRLWPRPAASASLVAGFADLPAALAAALRVLAAPCRPSFVDLLAGACTVQLAVGFDGSPERVEGELQRCPRWVAQAGHQGSEILRGTEDRALREGLDDPPAALGADDGATVLRWWGRPTRLRGALDAAFGVTKSLRVHARPGLGQVFLATVAGPGEGPVRALLAALAVHGNTVLLAGGAALRADPALVFGAPPPDLSLMAAVKRAFDPSAVLCPGRFVGGL